MDELITQSSGSRAGTRWRSVLFFVFGMLSGLGILSGIFYFSNSSFAKSRDGLLAQTATIFKGTIRDMLGARVGKPVLEIDLSERSVVSEEKNLTKESENNESSETPTNSANSTIEKAKTSPPATNSKPKSYDPRKEKSEDLPAAPQDVLTKTKTGASYPLCDFDTNQPPNHSVLINEIAWMGTATSSDDEWIELRNNFGNLVELRDWQLVNESGKFRIVFLESDKLPANSFYLAERSSDDTVPGMPANKIYLGAISNSNIVLKLFDSNCRLVDEVDASGGWKRLGGDNTAKKTLERNVRDFDWHTSSVVGGTPGKKNDDKFAATTNIANSGITKHNLVVNKSGLGAGVIVSSPSGISCGSYCSLGFSAGSIIVLSAVPDNDSVFSGWDLPSCPGTGDCQVTIDKSVELTAIFGASPSPASSTGDAATSTPSSTPPTNNSDNVNKIVISEIMVGSELGSDDEFIELWNQGTQVVVLTGWSIKKKTSSGAESTLVSASRLEGKSIPAGKKLLLANEGGYKGSTPTDIGWPKSYTLAYTNNSVVLYDANGNKIDEADWTEIPKNQSYERQGNSFVVQPSPNPQNSAQ